MTSASAAKAYYRASDYYASVPGVWLGEGAEKLGLTGPARPEDFDRLADNLHPQTGERLTTYTRDGRRVGMDMTFNATKSVSIAREMAGPGNEGDPQIETAHDEAVAYTLSLIEKEMQARVRVGGSRENRITGNLVAYAVTHRDTRINAEDGKPDPSLHKHVFIMNATWDPVEQKWKAAELGQLKHDLPFFEAVFHNRLASNLKELGYGVERKGKAFEIAGVSDELGKKFSRRTAYIEKVAGKLGITKPESKAKLGATTRLGKAKELADDLNGYYVSRLTGEEKQQLAGLEGWAGYESNPKHAVEFAIGHLFERRSVVEEKKVYEAALRHGIGSVTPEAVAAEAKRQGLLVRNGEATTKAVLAEEQRVIAFARDGKGTCRPLGNAKGRPGDPERPLNTKEDGVAGLELHSGLDGSRMNGGLQTKLATALAVAQPAFATDTHVSPSLSPEQAVMVNHVLTSPDRVMLVIGDAGTGKTFAVRSAFNRIDRPVEIIAPSADASRGVLRREGFSNADTVTAFLGNRDRQAGVKNGVIWVDEAGLLPIRDLSLLVDVAKAQNARLVLQGDPKQHRSVARDGNMLNVLQSHAGLPVARLKDIRRQRDKYKKAVTALADGRFGAGFDAINDLGWVKETPVFDHNQPLVGAYLDAVDTKRSDQDVTDRVLAIAPTHVEANEVTAAIRDGLKARGMVGKEEHQVSTLVPLHWTEAERGDLERFEGTEVIQFHRKSGSFKAGQRIAIADFKKGDRLGKPSTYAVYRPASVNLAEGDRIRITGNGWTADKKHRLDNGAQYEVAGFEDDGKIRLTNGWFVAPDFGHLSHGYVATSHASQGKTVDRVLIAMGHESLPAISAEQFYVSVSRGRDQATIFTGVAPAVLREAIQRGDARKSATELMGTKERREWWLARRARAAWEALRGRVTGGIPERQQQREMGYAR